MSEHETNSNCLIEALREEKRLRRERGPRRRSEGVDDPIEEITREEPEETLPMDTDLPWPPDLVVADGILDRVDSNLDFDDPIEEITREEPEEILPMDTDLPWPPDPATLKRWLEQVSPNAERRSELESCAQAEAAAKKEGRVQRELPADVNPHDLSATGWGVITPRGMTERYLDLLDPLIERRKQQAGKLFRQDLVYDLNQTPADFLWKTLDLSPGVVDPKNVPYYLLIVGGPEWIPFEVQYLLSINHAVGRIAFDETKDADFDAYRRWAQAVVDAETHGVDRPRKASILSVDSGDRATQTLRTHLVEPIADRIGQLVSEWPDSHSWKIEVCDGKRASKEGFRQVLGGEETPALSLVAAHGLSLDRENSHQKAFQGAFACQTERSSPIEAHYFHAADISRTQGDNGNGTARGSLHGSIAFLFSCYGAGTPHEDDYPQHTSDGYRVDPLPPPKVLTDKPFIAALPQEMLRQGALAVIGHVDRGWTLSFAWTLALRYTDAVRSLEESLKQLLRGHRLGHAMRAFHRRYTAIAAHLSDVVNRRRLNGEVEVREVGVHWTAHHDARNFIVLGDPAVYLRGQSDPGHPGQVGPWHSDQPVDRSADSEAIVLSPDLEHYVEQEAADAGLTPSGWLERLLRERIVTRP